MSEVFDNHVLAALRAHAGAWHCMLCWAREANVNPAEDLALFRLLARRLASPASTSSPAPADATDAGA